MKYVDWDKGKNERLKAQRNICFEDVVTAIENDDILDTIDHPNNKQYPNQKIFVIAIEEYVFLVPFVEDEEKYFLKTIIPSRKATKYYLKKKK